MKQKILAGYIDIRSLTFRYYVINRPRARRPFTSRETIVEMDRVVLGDCIRGLAELGPESVDLVFADPPFNIGYDYDVYVDKRDPTHYLEWTKAWGHAVNRVLKPTGAFWLAIGDEYAAELKLIFQKEVG